ncbi:MAG: NADH-quinone oxidoreductase subunit NuoH [Armatimonadetes bacterium]|nr:NADH-quinone oxidoreductase subunit NuoH [Armatimonadota bacterium]
MTIPNLRLGPLDLASALPYLAVAAMLGAVLLAVPILTWFERVMLGLIHDRLGPNRVGPRGLLQPIADGIKLFFKEDVLPRAVDRHVFYLAPALAMIPPLAASAVIPLQDLQLDMGGGRLRQVAVVAADINVGVLWVLGLASLQVYGLILGGWASDNKYSLLGALRSSAQAISYEIAMSFGVMTAVLMSQSMSLVDIVRGQAGGILEWNVLQLFPFGLIAACVFAIAAVAETNRTPFDLPEAESELVAGFQTEYSSMKFAVFFMSEYASVVIVSAMATVLWFGGWQPVHPSLGFVPGVVWLFGKIAALIFAFVWFRSTLPRFRYDALMRFGWKRLFPIALIALMGAAALDVYRTSPTLESRIPAKPAKPKPLMTGPEAM